MSILAYQPLNLYTNYRDAAEAYPDVPIIHDEILPAFPELGYRSTYHSSHEIILKAGVSTCPPWRPSRR